ncbi:MAG: hypothetical protein B6247_04145 [Candidatus Parabeggiatoa sp. nov. 2]|nr:MAG: hypothetical protein B6247_04145 [Beggiatoa sp. 4572_84]
MAVVQTLVWQESGVQTLVWQVFRVLKIRCLEDIGFFERILVKSIKRPKLKLWTPSIESDSYV